MACFGLALSNADWTDEDLEVEQSSRFESVVNGKYADGLNGKVALPHFWMITFATFGLQYIDSRSLPHILDWMISTFWTERRLARHLLGTSPPHCRC